MPKSLDDVLVRRISSGQMVVDERGHIHYLTGQERRRRILAAHQREDERFERVRAKRSWWHKLLEKMR